MDTSKKFLFNLRGTNGTGKSTVAHQLIKDTGATPLEYWPMGARRTNKRKVRAYAGTFEGVPIAILGSYETVCGGMDTITDINDARELIVEYGLNDKFPIVFYEGLFISHMLGTVARGIETSGLKENLTMAYLDTPLDVAIARVEKRRAERGNKTPFNPNNVIKDFRAVSLNKAKAENEGWSVITVDHTNAYAEVTKFLRGSANTVKMNKGKK